MSCWRKGSKNIDQGIWEGNLPRGGIYAEVRNNSTVPAEDVAPAVMQFGMYGEMTIFSQHFFTDVNSTILENWMPIKYKGAYDDMSGTVDSSITKDIESIGGTTATSNMLIDPGIEGEEADGYFLYSNHPSLLNGDGRVRATSSEDLIRMLERQDDYHWRLQS